MADIAASAATPAASATAAALAGLDNPLWAEFAVSLGALLLVLVLAWLLLRWLRRSQSGRGMRDGPRVIRSVGIGTRERLVVVEHRGVEYLLGVTAASISVIERRGLEDPQDRIEPTL